MIDRAVSEETKLEKQQNIIIQQQIACIQETKLLSSTLIVTVDGGYKYTKGNQIYWTKNTSLSSLIVSYLSSGVTKNILWQRPLNYAGQVTDDTELAICLAYGLMDCICKTSQMTRLKNNENKDNESEEKDDENKKKTEYAIFGLSKIAIEYRRWMDSNPFDMGFCTQATLSVAPNVANMKKKAFQYNQSKTKSNVDSKASIFKGNMANGSLMRCMPLCVYGYKLGYDNLYKIMSEDSSLTHANVCVYLVNTCYAIMIQSLLTAKVNDKQRNVAAFKKMESWLESQTTKKKRGRYERAATEEEIQREEIKCEAAKEILKVWLEFIDVESIGKSENDELLQVLHPATQFEGFVEIAFQRACYHLLKGNGFKDAICSVISEGGDTDTNACIVGGLMGAYHGLNGIPNEYIINIHKCNPIVDKNRDIFQAKWYFKDKIPELLVKNAPDDDNFVSVDDY